MRKFVTNKLAASGRVTNCTARSFHSSPMSNVISDKEATSTIPNAQPPQVASKHPLETIDDNDKSTTEPLPWDRDKERQLHKVEKVHWNEAEEKPEEARKKVYKRAERVASQLQDVKKFIKDEDKE